MIGTGEGKQGKKERTEERTGAWTADWASFPFPFQATPSVSTGACPGVVVAQGGRDGSVGHFDVGPAEMNLLLSDGDTDPFTLFS